MRHYGTREETAQIVELLRSQPELSYKEIGLKFGRTEFAVGSIAKRHGLMHGRIGRRRFTTRPRITEAKIITLPIKRRTRFDLEDEIIAYVIANPQMTYREIAEHFQVPHSRVGNLVYRRGVRRSMVTDEARAERKKLAEYIAVHPEESYSDIGRKFNLPTLYIGRTARLHNLFRGKGQGPRHNYTALEDRGSVFTVEQRQKLSEDMTRIWESVSDKHKSRVSKIMSGSWTEEKKLALSTALKKMWKEAKTD